MKLFSGSKNSNILLLFALIAALLFAVYYYVVLPKNDEVKLTQSSINSLQNEIKSIKQQISVLESEKSIEANTFELRKKLPETREIDQLILNIEEIEYISGIQVTNISFNNYDSAVSESDLGNQNESKASAEDTTQSNQEVDETEEQSEEPVTSIAKEALPSELKIITFNIDLKAPNYESLQQFIEEIENLERVMHIDTISYSLPGEENEFAEEPTDEVTASIQITTFYYEGDV